MNTLSNCRDETKEKRNHHSSIEILCMMNESHKHVAEGAVHHNQTLEKSPDTRRGAETHIDVSGGICNKPYTHSCNEAYTPSLSAKRCKRSTHLFPCVFIHNETLQIWPRPYPHRTIDTTRMVAMIIPIPQSITPNRVGRIDGRGSSV